MSKLLHKKKLLEDTYKLILSDIKKIILNNNIQLTQQETEIINHSLPLSTDNDIKEVSVKLIESTQLLLKLTRIVPVHKNIAKIQIDIFNSFTNKTFDATYRVCECNEDPNVKKLYSLVTDIYYNIQMYNTNILLQVIGLLSNKDLFIKFYNKLNNGNMLNFIDLFFYKLDISYSKFIAKFNILAEKDTNIYRMYSDNVDNNIFIFVPRLINIIFQSMKDNIDIIVIDMLGEILANIFIKFHNLKKIYPQILGALENGSQYLKEYLELIYKNKYIYTFIYCEGDIPTKYDKIDNVKIMKMIDIKNDNIEYLLGPYDDILDKTVDYKPINDTMISKINKAEYISIIFYNQNISNKTRCKTILINLIDSLPLTTPNINSFELRTNNTNSFEYKNNIWKTNTGESLYQILLINTTVITFIFNNGSILTVYNIENNDSKLLDDLDKEIQIVARNALPFLYDNNYIQNIKGGAEFKISNLEEYILSLINNIISYENKIIKENADVTSENTHREKSGIIVEDTYYSVIDMLHNTRKNIDIELGNIINIESSIENNKKNISVVQNNQKQNTKNIEILHNNGIKDPENKSKYDAYIEKEQKQLLANISEEKEIVENIPINEKEKNMYEKKLTEYKAEETEHLKKIDTLRKNITYELTLLEVDEKTVLLLENQYKEIVESLIEEKKVLFDKYLPLKYKDRYKIVIYELTKRWLTNTLVKEARLRKTADILGESTIVKALKGIKDETTDTLREEIIEILNKAGGDVDEAFVLSMIMSIFFYGIICTFDKISFDTVITYSDDLLGMYYASDAHATCFLKCNGTLNYYDDNIRKILPVNSAFFTNIEERKEFMTSTFTANNQIYAEHYNMSNLGNKNLYLIRKYTGTDYIQEYKKYYDGVTQNKYLQTGGIMCNDKYALTNHAGTCWTVAIESIYAFYKGENNIFDVKLKAIQTKLDEIQNDILNRLLGQLNSTLDEPVANSNVILNLLTQKLINKVSEKTKLATRLALLNTIDKDTDTIQSELANYKEFREAYKKEYDEKYSKHATELHKTNIASYKSQIEMYKYKIWQYIFHNKNNAILKNKTFINRLEYVDLEYLLTLDKMDEPTGVDVIKNTQANVLDETVVSKSTNKTTYFLFTFINSNNDIQHAYININNLRNNFSLLESYKKIKNCVLKEYLCRDYNIKINDELIKIKEQCKKYDIYKSKDIDKLTIEELIKLIEETNSNTLLYSLIITDRLQNTILTNNYINNNKQMNI